MVTAGELARQVYTGMQREAASLKIQRCFRMHFARKAYKELHTSAVSIQTGMRGMAARCELRFKRQTRAAIVIQVENILEKFYHLKSILNIAIIFGAVS